MVGIYCRISKHKEEGKDVSIEVQKKQGTAFAIEMGEQYKFFIDEGRSGTTDKISERPEFVRLMNAIKKKEITIVYCYDQSRIERSTRIWILFSTMMLDHDCLYYPGGNPVNLNDPESRLYTGIMSLTNEFYAASTGVKVKKTIEINAKKGKTHGLTAYGYEKGQDGLFKINDEEADVVKRIFSLSLSGIGAYSIANKLNEDGIPTKFNRYKGQFIRKESYTNQITRYNKKDVRWRGTVVYEVLTNPIYKGTRLWNNEPVPVPKIFNEEYWNEVNDNLQRNKKKSGKKEEYHYLLNGLMYCADCGSEIKGKKRLKGNDNAYKCKGKSRHTIKCKSRGISLPKLDTFIIHHLFVAKDLQKHLMGLQENKVEVDSLKGKMEKIRKELGRNKLKEKKAYDVLLDPDFESDPTIKANLLALKKTIKDQEQTVELIENKLIEREALSRKNRVKNLIGGYRFDSTFDDTKRLVHSLVERITIKHEFNIGAKSGYYLIEIAYRGFDEVSIFLTNWQAYRWSLISYYRKEATTEAELEDDKELMISYLESKGSSIRLPDDFKGLESTGASFAGMIKLTKEGLIHFD